MSVNIEFRDVTYSVQSRKSSKTILKSLNGEFRAGKITAIMGPSGAGKSTLMNILAGFKGEGVNGSIYVNGLLRDRKLFRKMSCYIMQTDKLNPYFSVKEAMCLAANLKIGDQLTQDEKTLVVNKVLETFGLNSSSSVRINKLSGGQRKRLSIALEMVNNPSVMFLDEPTSGLDSTNCSQCISILKNLAVGGRTIVCVIHQPSSSIFEMFDHLYLIADGRCLYEGLPSGLVGFLSVTLGLYCPKTYNPADFALDVACGKYGDTIDQMATANSRNLLANVRGSKILVESDVPSKRPEIFEACESCSSEHSYYNQDKFVLSLLATCFWTQFILLVKRSFTATMRDLTLNHLKMAVHIAVGILVGLIYFDIGNEASKVHNNISQIYFSQLILMFTGVISTVLTFPLEMPVLVREHLNNWYTLKAYFLSKTIIDFIFQIVYPSMYITIVYFMTGQPHEASRFFMFLIINILGSLVAQSIGLLIGAIFDFENAAVFGGTSIAPAFLFSGYFITFNTIPAYLKWLCYTVYLRFSFEGSLASVYDFNRTKLHCAESFCLLTSGSRILEQLDILENMYWIDLIALIVYYFVVRILAYVFLRIRIYSKYEKGNNSCCSISIAPSPSCCSCNIF